MSEALYIYIYLFIYITLNKITKLYFQANSLANSLEKKQKSFDKVIAEWKQRVDDLAAELDASQRECRNYSTEVFKLRTQYEESQEQYESVRRENKNLQGIVKIFI